MHCANDRGPYREFPWALFLPPDEVPRFLADVAAAGERGLDALEQTVTEWRHTAEIHAEPWLARRLSEPVTGDYGAVLPPDQFDELTADDEPDPAPKLAEAASRDRRFVRREHRSLDDIKAQHQERLHREGAVPLPDGGLLIRTDLFVDVLLPLLLEGAELRQPVVDAAIAWRKWIASRPVELLHVSPEEAALIAAVDVLTDPPAA